MMIIIPLADMFTINRMQARVARAFGFDRPKRARESEDDESSLCVEGLAVITDEPIATKTGDIVVFEKGCFDVYLASAPQTPFWLEHNSSKVVAKSGVEIAKIDGGGLAFRAPLAGSRYEATVCRMIDSATQAAISIGVTHDKYRTEKVGKHDVIFVDRATISEVSLVKAGACEVAFARLVDGKHASLTDSAKSTPFAIERGLHNIRVQQGKNVDRLDILARKIDALESGRRATKAARH